MDDAEDVEEIHERTNQDDDEIKASANDQSKLAELSSMETPLLESTTNVLNNTTKTSKKGSKPASGARNKTSTVKFVYTHRISYTCLLKILQIYFALVFLYFKLTTKSLF